MAPAALLTLLGPGTATGTALTATTFAELGAVGAGAFSGGAAAGGLSAIQSLALAGTGASTLSNIQSARFQADVAQQNQEIARQSGALNARNALVRGTKRAAAASARRGASGIDPNVGSALDLDVQAAGEVELDRLTALFNGQLAARDSRVQEIGARRRIASSATSGIFSSGLILADNNKPTKKTIL